MANQVLEKLWVLAKRVFQISEDAALSHEQGDITVRDLLFWASKLPLDRKVSICTYWVQGDCPVRGLVDFGDRAVIYSQERRGDREDGEVYH